MEIPISTLRLGLAAFWALWFTTVWVMNLLDAMRQLGLLPQGWKVASDNYAAITKHTGAFGAPEWLNRALYAGVIVWQALTAALLWAGVLSSLAGEALAPARLYAGFGAGLLLFAIFLIADEILKLYDTAQQHMVILIALLASLLLWAWG